MNSRVLGILFISAVIDVVALVVAFSFAGASLLGNFHPLRWLFPYYMIAVQVGVPLGETLPGLALVIVPLALGSLSLLVQYPVYAGLLIYANRRQKTVLAGFSLFSGHAGGIALAY